MSAAKVDTPLIWDDLVRIWCELDVPEGWRPETAIDGIRLSPPPEGSLLFGVMGENDEVADDLVRDITEVLTSMCARLYGRRSAKKRAQNGVAACAAEP